MLLGCDNTAQELVTKNILINPVHLKIRASVFYSEKTPGIS